MNTTKLQNVEHAKIKWAASSEFMSLSIPSWQILTAHAQPFRGARNLAFCLKVPLDSLPEWSSSGGCAGLPNSLDAAQMIYSMCFIFHKVLEKNGVMFAHSTIRLLALEDANSVRLSRLKKRKFRFKKRRLFGKFVGILPLKIWAKSWENLSYAICVCAVWSAPSLFAT